MNNAKYDRYLDDHIENVNKAYILLMPYLKKYNVINSDTILENLEKRIEKHDTSKYDKQEYDAYANYYFGNKPVSKDVQQKFDYAWLHHIKHNSHHWEAWVIPGDKALEMPTSYVVEMICDWWSFGLSKDNPTEIFDWYKEHKSTMILHDSTRKLVEELLGLLKIVIYENPIAFKIKGDK